MVSGVGRGMDVLDCQRGRCSFGGEFEASHCNPIGPLLCSCAEVCEPIKLSCGVVSGVGPGIDVWTGVHVAQGRGVVLGLFASKA